MALSKNAIIGYPAGIITGITYGLNPLFAVPLMHQGASVEGILFFRYGIAVVLLGLFLLLSQHSFKVTLKQAVVLLVLGVFFTLSSALLFVAYNYIASGLATTLVFIYPALVAIIMVFLRVVPSLPVWLSIFATFIGVMIMTYSEGAQSLDPLGIVFSLLSALSYALFIVIIYHNKTIKEVSSTLLTFYSLTVGSFIFLAVSISTETSLFLGINSARDYIYLLGLAIIPTIISTATLAIASRNIGATKASILGVFEPITAILVGSLIFGEPLSFNIILGILIAVIAVTFMIVLTKR